jgi:hypothetical protein
MMPTFLDEWLSQPAKVYEVLLTIAIVAALIVVEIRRIK